MQKSSAVLLLIALQACSSPSSGVDAGSDAGADVGAVTSEAVVVETTEPTRLAYGTITRRDYLVSGATFDHPAIQGIWLWSLPDGCELAPDPEWVGQLVELYIDVRGRTLNEEFEIAPTVGEYTVVDGFLAGRELAPGEGRLLFEVFGDGMVVGELEATSGVVRIEAVTEASLTVSVDAELSDGTRVRGRVTVGICDP